MQFRMIKRKCFSVLSLAIAAAILLTGAQTAFAAHYLIHPGTLQGWKPGDEDIEVVMAGSKPAMIKKASDGIKFKDGQIFTDFMANFHCGDGLSFTGGLEAIWTPIKEAQGIVMANTKLTGLQHASRVPFLGARISSVANMAGLCTAPGAQRIEIPVKLSVNCVEITPGSVDSNNVLAGTGAVGEAIGEGVKTLSDGLGSASQAAGSVVDDVIDLVSGTEAGMQVHTKPLWITLNCTTPPDEVLSTVVPTTYEIKCPAGMRFLGTEKDRILTQNPNEQRMCTDEPWVAGGKG
jgi:hypothetical protein